MSERFGGGKARAARVARAAWRAFRAEKLGFLVFGGAAAGLLSFLEIADDMAEGDTHGVDEALMLMLRDPGRLSEPVGPAWLKTMAMDFTALGSLAVLGLVSLWTVRLVRARRQRAGNAQQRIP